MARRIREARERAGIKQKELADRVGVVPHTMWRYEAGKITPSAEVLDLIAAELGVSSVYLLRGDDATKPGPAAARKDADEPRTPLHTEARRGLEIVISYCLRKQPDRWSQPTIAAARSLASDLGVDLTPDDWETRLDLIEETLGRGMGNVWPLKRPQA